MEDNFKDHWDNRPYWKEGTTDKEMALHYYRLGLMYKRADGSKVPCSDGLSNPAYVKDELEKILKYLEDDHVTKNQHRLGCLGSSEIASAVEKIKSLIKKG